MGLIPYDPRNPVDGTADYDGDGMSNAEEFALNRDLFFVETDNSDGGETAGEGDTTGTTTVGDGSSGGGESTGEDSTAVGGSNNGTGTTGGSGSTYGGSTTGSDGTNGGGSEEGGTNGSDAGTVAPHSREDIEIVLETRHISASYIFRAASEEETIDNPYFEWQVVHTDELTGEETYDWVQTGVTTEIIEATKDTGIGRKSWREYGDVLSDTDDSISSIAEGLAYVESTQIPDGTDWFSYTPDGEKVYGGVASAAFSSGRSEEDSESGSGAGGKFEVRITRRDPEGNLVALPEAETRTYLVFHTTPQINGEVGTINSVEKLELTIPAGAAESVNENQPSVHSSVLAPRTGPDTKSGVSLLPVEIVPDHNRDGIIDDSDKGQSSESQPFSFWLNNDQDDNEYGETWPASSADSSDGEIKSIRDLEDFARLNIYLGGLHDQILNGELKLGIQWGNVTEGSPSLKIWKNMSPDGGTEYLTDNATAESNLQLQNPGHVQGNSSYIIPTSYLADINFSATNPFAHLLFEACTPGKGQLTLTLHDSNDTQLGGGSGIWLELKDIKKFYNMGFAPENINPDGQQDPLRSGGDQFDGAQWDETEDTIIFVHGWRMSPQGRSSFAETFYKRLWHRGFKGRFAAFRWNTYWSESLEWLPLAGGPIDAYLSKYNQSEQIAWKSAESLKHFADSLPGSQKHLAAHSMGNVVTSEAVRLGMGVQNYALMQPAVPAACYDDDEGRVKQSAQYNHLGGLTMWDNVTPDSDTDSPTRSLAYRGRFQHPNFAPVNLVSFFLPPDYATFMPWEINNDQTKPEEANIDDRFYHYERSADSGEKLYKNRLETVSGGTGGTSTYEVFDYFVTDPYESMPFCTRTWGKAQGAQNRSQGVINGNVDLRDADFTIPSENDPGFGDEHSGQFNANIQDLRAFYNRLLDEFVIPSNQ